MENQLRAQAESAVEHLPVKIDKEAECKKYRQCRTLAEAGYYEARGESDEGVVAVMYVIVNRTLHSRWPNTILQVVYQKSQFSYTFDGSLKKSMDLKQKQRMMELAWDVIHQNVPNPVGNADHYHTTAVSPGWSKRLRFVGRIGNHLFYEGKT